MKKIVFLLFACFFICNIAYASIFCNRTCTYACPQDEDDDVTFGFITADGDSNQRICSNTTYGFGNALIGWGTNCAISAGDQSPSQYSCINTGNVFGQVIDTITTLGAAAQMRANFCSFSPGDYELEGAIIKSSILEICSGLNGEAAHNCMSCILKGKTPNDTGTGCNTPTSDADKDCYNPKITNTGPNLCVDKYYIATYDASDPDSYLCSGMPNLEKPLLDDNGSAVFVNGAPVYCPIMRCNIPTSYIKAKYYDNPSTRNSIMTLLMGPLGLAEEAASAIAGYCCDLDKFYDGTFETAGFGEMLGLGGSIYLAGVQQADQICVQMYFPGAWRTLACKASIPPETSFPDVACFVQKTPFYQGDFKSQWIFPMTSKIMQVTTEVFDSVFTGEYNGEASCQTGLTTFQNNMKNVVRVLLVLYVMLFGFRIATGKERIGKRDLFIFILKFALVIYFSVGPLYKTTTTDIDDNGLILLRNIAQSGMETFSNMIVEAGTEVDNGGNTSSLCDFSNVSYDSDYSYLKMWDTLDCKLSFYLGFMNPTQNGFESAESGTSALQLAIGIFGLLWGLLFSGNLLFLIFLFAFGIFVLSLVIYFTQLYIIAMIAVTMMIFFGPIFVPLALFKQTRQYFDGWLRILIGYVLQPMIVVGVISFMIATFDSIIYSDCKFSQQALPTGSPYWTLDDASSQSQYCTGSFGYNLANFLGGQYTEQGTAQGDGTTALYQYSIVTTAINSTTMLEGLMLVTFFAFLFYFFADQIGRLAQEISGASLGGQTISPTAVVDGIVNLATQIRGKEPKQRISTGSEDSADGVTVSSGAARSGVSVSAARPESSSAISSGEQGEPDEQDESGISVSGKSSDISGFGTESSKQGEED